ncbi:Mismatch repair endonuclease PMS2 [Dirofilaria immitis]|nr:Mismatch repair endonuclease PMS2 [Dirofilaria immitis]
MGNVDRQVIHAEIHSIPADVRRKICTGQVVITLTSACKELIDNSLDAESKTIEIRVKKMGFEKLEVIDDGIGIHSTNFDVLCKPHSTSKLTNFSDFNQLTTLGFRGEALSSLCAVSSVSIITRHADETVATKLQFDHNGSIISREKCARPVGTTTSISNLFETLPSFALSRTDVRFVVNSLMDGKQHQALMTPGGGAPIKDVIVNLLVHVLKKQEPDESICSFYGISDHSKFDDIRITGYISSCIHGQGRSIADRQFIYFNKRSVDYAKLCRIANEVYQQYNRGQYCMLILFIDVPPGTIFEREKELFALLRASLLATFAPHLGHVDTSNQSITTNDLSHLESTDDSFIHLTQPNDSDNSFDISAQGFQSSFESTDISQSTTITFARDKSRGPSVNLMNMEKTTEKTRKRHASNNCPEKSTSIQKRPAPNLFEKYAFKVIPHNTKEVTTEKSIISEASLSSIIDEREKLISEGIIKNFRETSLRTLMAGASKDENNVLVSQEDANFPDVSDDDDDDDNDNEVMVADVKDDHNCKISLKAEGNCDTTHRTQQTISFSMSDLKKRMNELHLEAPKIVSNVCSGNERIIESHAEFHIDSPEIAESELAAYISLEKDFESMEILGQFNKGFIIVRLNNDLFIVDQHASDEKYNFELLQRKARIQTQRLISPRVLDLGVVKEAILRDNVDIFNYNGFEFQFDDDELVGKRALLTAVPVLQSWQFSISDIDEMLSVLCDFPGMMYRPAKLRKLFASRACRKSIVRHLGTLDHPWNCPHGRPTLRHLCALGSKTFG